MLSRHFRLLSILVVLLLMPVSARAELEENPDLAGLSREGVAKLDALLAAFVQNHLTVGGVAVIERDGTVGYCKAFGKQSLETGQPMAKDTIFRIYSMTKAVTSVATMMLYEEGKFGLDDPVEKYLPELGGMKVGVETPGTAGGKATLTLVDAVHPPTIRELLSHTAGLGYGIVPTSQVERMYKDAGLLKDDEPLAEKIRKLGKLPLKHQPGSQWDYSIAADVLGRLVEVLSGMPLDAFFQQHIFAPLGMVDTGFFVPEEKRARFAGMYSLTLSGQFVAPPDEIGRDFLSPPKMLMGGGGLVSTAEDYLRFCRMLLNEGKAGERRLLKADTVKLMTTDVLGDRPISMMGYALGLRGAGFGLGFSVTKHAFEDTRGALGEYNWGGAASTVFWIDPEKQMIGLYLVQIIPSNFTTALQFKKAAYGALAK